jgi:hypothetical protein
MLLPEASVDAAGRAVKKLDALLSAHPDLTPFEAQSRTLRNRIRLPLNGVGTSKRSFTVEELDLPGSL